jgi:hypothetical protein
VSPQHDNQKKDTPSQKEKRIPIEKQRRKKEDIDIHINE